jgi:hypothetical protein
MATAPKTNKNWAKEITQAISEAEALLQETEQELGEKMNNRLFVSAPVIAMKTRGVDFTKRQDAIDFACESVVSMLREFPELKDKPKRCFVHAYIDTHIYLKLFKQSKSEELFFLLENKAIIES